MKTLWLVLMCAGLAGAQTLGGKAFLETKGSFLKSTYCQKYRCSLLTRFSPGADELEELYLVKYPTRNRFVLLQSYRGKVGGIGFRYPGGNDIPEWDGKAALSEMVEFATGTRISEDAAFKVLENAPKDGMTFKAKDGFKYTVYSDSVIMLRGISIDFRFFIQRPYYQD